MSLKKSELIIGAFKEAFPADTGVYGINHINFKSIYEKLVIAPRYTLENNKLIRHLISYCPALRLTDDGVLQVLLYQRPDNNSGELRLAGNFSIGFGGHVEYTETGTALIKCKTLDEAAEAIQGVLIATTARENDEEVRPNTSEQLTFSQTVVGNPGLCAAIIDNTDDVGLHHVGFVTMYLVRNGIEYLAGVNENDAIRIKGWHNVSDLTEPWIWDKMESWSKMLTSFLSNNALAITLDFKEQLAIAKAAGDAV